ncbi:MAG: hypothetical protein ABSE00_08820 [Chitinispirillaceae bacterium]|jgi:transposase
MAYNREMKEKFLDLKATGLSINKIAVALGISRTTALRWAAQLQEQIETRESLAVEEILERHRLKRVAEIEDIAAMREKIREAIKARDFNNESLRELMSLDKHFGERSEKLIIGYSAHSGHYVRDLEHGGRYALPEEVRVNID